MEKEDNLSLLELEIINILRNHPSYAVWMTNTEIIKTIHTKEKNTRIKSRKQDVNRSLYHLLELKKLQMKEDKTLRKKYWNIIEEDTQNEYKHTNDDDNLISGEEIYYTVS